jgi:hypothetical protein
MKNYMLLPATKPNQVAGNDHDEDDLEEPKEAFSDCEQGTFPLSIESIQIHFLYL